MMASPLNPQPRAADIKSIELLDETKKAGETSSSISELLVRAKKTLESVVEDVRLSDRLSESAACLVAPEFGLDLRLQQILAAHGSSGADMKPVLEINPSHPLILALESLAKNDPGDLFDDAIWLIFDEARLLDGAPPKDASFFAARLTRILTKAVEA